MIKNKAQVPICALVNVLAIIINVNTPNNVDENLWKKLKKIDLNQ
jgi:hypothetical protein